MIEADPSITNMLAVSRSSLSLTLDEMASALHAERTAVYGWLSRGTPPHGRALDRLKALRAIAERWDTISSLPVGDFIREPGPDGVSVLDLLREDEIPQSVIVQRLEGALNEGLAPRRKSKSILRRLYEQHGVELPEDPKQREIIDILTGKRMGPE